MNPEPTPSPALFMDTVGAGNKSAALKGAIDLGLFTVIAAGANDPEKIAAQCQAAPRGVRILCDYLTIMGFLTKNDGAYGLTPDSATFLDQRSPAYLGGMLDFLLDPRLTGKYQDVAAIVRKGGAVDTGTLSPEDPVWIKFAQGMVPMMMPTAQQIANLIGAPADAPLRVLDISASHGMYGLTIAQRHPNAQVTGLDWANVLEVARANAAKLGAADRYRTIAGSAFAVDFQGPYELVLLPNFLHHFDPPTNETLLRKVADALVPGGQVVIVEFVPNDDRVSPPMPAGFSFTMLASTPSGDAYTFRELESMLRNTGYTDIAAHPTQGPQTIILARKA